MSSAHLIEDESLSDTGTGTYKSESIGTSHDEDDDDGFSFVEVSHTPDHDDGTENIPFPFEDTFVIVNNGIYLYHDNSDMPHETTCLPMNEQPPSCEIDRVTDEYGIDSIVRNDLNIIPLLDCDLDVAIAMWSDDWEELISDDDEAEVTAIDPIVQRKSYLEAFLDDTHGRTFEATKGNQSLQVDTSMQKSSSAVLPRTDKEERESVDVAGLVETSFSEQEPYFGRCYNDFLKSIDDDVNLMNNCEEEDAIIDKFMDGIKSMRGGKASLQFKGNPKQATRTDALKSRHVDHQNRVRRSNVRGKTHKQPHYDYTLRTIKQPRGSKDIKKSC